ncbi:MAG: flagellar export chaperone FliS [Geminicoccaceae bacterium]
MMAMRQAMNAYGQATQTIPPAQQIVMLYDGIIKQLKVARGAVAERRINDRYVAVQKATSIIEALQSCLDFENGGEIAPQLDQLYTHYVFRIQAINMENDIAICDELLERIGELRASWAAIADTESKSATNAPGTSADLQPKSNPGPNSNPGVTAAVTA